MTFWVRIVCIAIILFQVIGSLPGPGPKPEPNPIPIPVVEGARRVVIIRESLDDTPAHARMFITLQSGANAEYIRSKGHAINILDDEQTDENGNPLALVQSLLPLQPPPALFVLEMSDGRPLHHEPLPETADDVMRVLRENGG